LAKSDFRLLTLFYIRSLPVDDKGSLAELTWRFVNSYVLYLPV